MHIFIILLRMKKFFLWLIIPLLFWGTSCTTVSVDDDDDAQDNAATTNLAPLPFNARPRVMIRPFKIGRRIWTYGYRGITNLEKYLPDRLESELMKTGRFIVVDRSRIKEIMNEQDFGESDRVDSRTSPGIGKIQGAQYYIEATILDLKMNQSGGAIGGATHGIGLGVGYKTSYVEIRVRVIHIATTQVVFSDIVKATATSYGLVAASVFSVNHRNYWVAGGGFYKTPIGKAVQAALRKIARKLAKAAGTVIPAQ
ncbi:MAG: hypothetical protein D6785_08510 [Planctomycetota bacterium]|nr:MAG: hypothetical protein D6785_08510 [Planctomycetota bacterium]